jgi:ribonuclease HI
MLWWRSNFVSYKHSFLHTQNGARFDTNNFAKLMSLKLLLLFSLEKDVHTIQLFGDSLLVINWIHKSQRCHNIILSPLFKEVFIILASFDNYSFLHVYREHNREADSLSKEGLQMADGTWMIWEDKDGSNFFCLHKYFLDSPPRGCCCLSLAQFWFVVVGSQGVDVSVFFCSIMSWKSSMRGFSPFPTFFFCSFNRTGFSTCL